MDAPTTGQTVWRGDADDGTHPVALGWDWVALRPGVFALADPLAIVSNLLLLDKQGRRLHDSATAMRLNAIVHRLPWQRAVRDVLDQSL